MGGVSEVSPSQFDHRARALLTARNALYYLYRPRKRTDIAHYDERCETIRDLKVKWTNLPVCCFARRDFQFSEATDRTN